MACITLSRLSMLMVPSGYFLYSSSRLGNQKMLSVEMCVPFWIGCALSIQPARCLLLSWKGPSQRTQNSGQVGSFSINYTLLKCAAVGALWSPMQFCHSLKDAGCKQEKRFLKILQKLEDSVLADISADVVTLLLCYWWHISWSWW